MSNNASAKPAYVSWQHPLRDAQISMSSAVMDLLSKEALRWLLSKPCTEIGGILRGRFSPEDGGSVQIEDAEFVFSENAFFNETPADASRLVEALRRTNSAELQPVGYFRSHIRDGLFLTAEDQKLIEAHLREPRSVFLLIRPYQMGICMAAFFFWENGRLETESSSLEVPFVETGVAQTPPDTAERRSSYQSEEDSETPSPANIPATLPRRPAASRRLWLQTTIAAVLLGAAGGSLVYLASHAGNLHSNPSQNVHLRATRLPNGQVDLTWDGNASALSTARNGILTIQDGSEHRRIVLDSAQLRSGRLPYFPLGRQLNVRLDIPADAQHTISESLSVASPETKALPAKFVPPHPLRRVMPDIGLVQPVVFSQRSQVRVQVNVDEGGKVTEAHVIPGTLATNEALFAPAIRAAQSWTFAPATLDGKPVPGTHTIIFEFTHPSR